MKISSTKLTGTDISKIVMENENGMLVELLSLGAGIRKVAVKTAGGYDTLTQSFTDYDAYIKDNIAYVGKTLGPNAGRFSVAEGIDLGNGKVMHPEANEWGINTLHGGSECVSTADWTVIKTGIEGEKAVAVFSTCQPDGLCGWTGNRNYKLLFIKKCVKTKKGEIIRRETHLRLRS